MELMHIMMRLGSYKDSLLKLWELEEKRKGIYSPHTTKYDSVGGGRATGTHSDKTARAVELLEKIEEQSKRYEQQRAYLLALLESFRGGEGLAVARDAAAVILDVLSYEYLKQVYYHCSMIGELEHLRQHVERLANYLDQRGIEVLYPWELSSIEGA